MSLRLTAPLKAPFVRHVLRRAGAVTSRLPSTQAAFSLGGALARVALLAPDGQGAALKAFVLAHLAFGAAKGALARDEGFASVRARTRGALGAHFTGEAAWTAPWADQRVRPRLYVDLTDVIGYAVWSESCAGIPRVQLEIATRLYRSNPSVCVFGLRNGKWCDLGAVIEAAEGDVDRIFALLKESFIAIERNLDGLMKLARRWLRNLLIPRRKQAPAPAAGDSLFIGGAFWGSPEILLMSEAAAANGARLFLIIHDLIPLTMPAFTGHDFAREYRAALRLPAHFIVTSELNRGELKRIRQDMAGGAADDGTCCSIVPLADEFPGAARGERAGHRSARLATLEGSDFALCVGTIEIRKNHMALIAAWRELGAECGGDLPRLVIVGQRGWKAAATLAELDALNPAGPIVFVEAASDGELRWLYGSCLFTLFPSFFEGWGLPVGESFWFGKPCAASSSPSIGPVARDLCAFFSPHDKDEMKTAIRTLCEPSARDFYRRSIEAAPLRTWSEVAADIADVIAERRPASAALAVKHSQRDKDAA